MNCFFYTINKSVLVSVVTVSAEHHPHPPEKQSCNQHLQTLTQVALTFSETLHLTHPAVLIFV